MEQGLRQTVDGLQGCCPAHCLDLALLEHLRAALGFLKGIQHFSMQKPMTECAWHSLATVCLPVSCTDLYA